MTLAEHLTPARSYFPGMGQAVADRTVNRKIVRPVADTAFVEFEIARDDSRSLEDALTSHAKNNGWVFDATTDEFHVDHGDGELVTGWYLPKGKRDIETWADVAARVAHGNALLDPRLKKAFDSPAQFGTGRAAQSLLADERYQMEHHLRQASLLMSGRHLQHGDETQPSRNMEVFTNCSTSATSFLLFYLLLNGSGVGRAYDDALMAVDWNQAPIVVNTIDWNHKDVEGGIIAGYLTTRDAEHLYADRKITIHRVGDSREGWAKAVEIVERMAFEKRREEVLILDYSDVRPRGAPIKGMQDRPASGPGPLMGAIAAVARIRDAGMAPWRAAMYADHYLAECVLVGGARRAARMATKSWRDRTVFDFIKAKRGGFLWSSNNSVTVDAEFRAAVEKVHALAGHLLSGTSTDIQVHNTLGILRFAKGLSEIEIHAYKVCLALTKAAYFDGTGEPAIINQDRLTQNDEGLEDYDDGHFAESERFKVDADSMPLMKELVRIVRGMGLNMIVNPCGEICLLILGAYCVIADVVPFFAGRNRMDGQTPPASSDWDNDAEDAFRTAVRALMRTNTMDCLYGREVRRTNRIGVGMTGFHEWAYDRFGFAWHDIIDEEKSQALWQTVARFKRAVVDEKISYARKIGVPVPHTDTTFKPAGTTSKLFGLTEGAHLPSMREFVRWVQFRWDDPLVKDYAALGYPIRELKDYKGTTIVGFPTKPTICSLDGGAWVVTAAEATPEEQYQFLRLLEKYWLTGVEADGVTPLAESGNQISYTLKYDPKKVSYEEFLSTLIAGQFTIRACSVMPQTDTSAYEYQPEQPVTKQEFEKIAAAIANENAKEDIGAEHVACDSGACPVDFSDTKVAA